jgi:hypothetical protein
MKPATERPALHRRQLLGAAGTTGALVAAGALLASRQPMPEPAASADAKPAPEQGGGYQVSAHVLRYYQTAKV